MDITHDLIREENRRIRLLRVLSDLLVQTIMTRRVTLSDADRMIHGLRDFATRLFPGKENVFDLIYLPRFRRALREAGLLSRNLLIISPSQSGQRLEEVTEHDRP